MKYRTLALLLLAVFFVNFIQAQTPWSLTDCIDYAHTNNLRIKQTEFQAKISDVEKLQAKTNLLPDFNASLSRGYAFGRNVDPYTNQFIQDNSVTDNFSLQSSVTLFAGLQNYNNIKRTEYSTLAAYSDIEKEKIEITFEISSAYLQILYQSELLEITKNQQGVVKMQVDRTAKLVESGSVAKGDLLEMSAQLASESLNVTEAENQLTLGYLNLAQLLDLDSIGDFSIIVPDSVEANFITQVPSMADVYSDAIAYLPHVKSAQYRVKSTEKALSINKGARSPILYVQGSLYTGYSDQRRLVDVDAAPTSAPIGYLESDPSQLVMTNVPVSMNYPYGEQINDNIAENFSIGLRVPILNRWEVNNNISKAKIQLEESENNLDLVEQQLLKQIQQAHNDAVSSKEKFRAAQEAVNSYREAFNYTEQKFSVGIVNSVEYNIAKNNFIKAESELLQSKYEYIFAVKILDFYRGIPMSL